MRFGAKLIVVSALAFSAGHAHAQVPPSYGFNFCTVGAPGNAPALPSDFVYLAGPMGAVDHSFRIAQTDVTNGQWIDFVRAYVAVNPSAANDPGLRGTNVYRTNPGVTPPLFAIAPGTENIAATMDWYFAARYCNWLQSGKSPQLSAFETGAYDSSGWGPGGTGQVNHSPDALFWIPTPDEYTKAAFYDPNRYGTGQGGYWLYPNRSNTPPVGGPPGTPGAETGSGSYPYDPNNPNRFYPVGSYPNSQTPWGLLDGSGEAQVWNDGALDFGLRVFRGTDNGFTDNSYWDRLDAIGVEVPIAFYGLRVASAVPSPTAALPVLIVIAWFRQRSHPTPPPSSAQSTR